MLKARGLMLPKLLRRTIEAAIWLVVVASSVGGAMAAAPRVILVHGELVNDTLRFADWEENLQLITSIGERPSISPAELTNRPSVKLSFFWGPGWDQYLNDGDQLRELEAKDANEQARFYPARGPYA